MDYISQPHGCWFEETETGRVTWIEKRLNHPGIFALRDPMDTPQGHRYEIWQASDLYPERRWASKPHHLFVDNATIVTVFVDPEIESVYIMVPSALGSTVKISSGSHPTLDGCRAQLCASVADGGSISLESVKQLFERMATEGIRKFDDIATVGIASFATVDDGVVSPTSSEYDEVRFLTGN